MSKEFVRRWFSRLPEVEKDLPLVIIGGVAYTPRMIYEEVMRGTPLGEKLQGMLEAGRLGTTLSDLYRLAKLRLRELLKRYPPDKPIVGVIAGEGEYVLTAGELLRHVEEETSIGRAWIENEILHMKRLLMIR